MRGRERSAPSAAAWERRGRTHPNGVARNFAFARPQRFDRSVVRALTICWPGIYMTTAFFVARGRRCLRLLRKWFVAIPPIRIVAR